MLENKKIAFGITSAFYAIERTIPQIEGLIKDGAEIIPVISFNSLSKEKLEFIEKIENITGKKIINTLEEAEKLGQKIPTDIMAIIPCTGNTIGKLANGIMDTPVLIAAKTNLKKGKNLVIGIATNDALSIQAENIGRLLKQKNIFFVPFRQDNPITKPASLIFSSIYVKSAIDRALDGEQVQPLLV